ncbi:MAG TPA: hypothetical protein VFL54_09100 [Gammaproteobacteria bacterium]|nr:hypothetical protein [Gammaproteobacteria bacterium]
MNRRIYKKFCKRGAALLAIHCPRLKVEATDGNCLYAPRNMQPEMICGRLRRVHVFEPLPGTPVVWECSGAECPEWDCDGAWDYWLKWSYWNLPNERRDRMLAEQGGMNYDAFRALMKDIDEELGEAA